MHTGQNSSIFKQSLLQHFLFSGRKNKTDPHDERETEKESIMIQEDWSEQRVYVKRIRKVIKVLYSMALFLRNEKKSWPLKTVTFHTSLCGSVEMNNRDRM